MDGIDTLLVHLLAAVGNAEGLGSFAAKPNQVVTELVAPQLQQQPQYLHALALLYAGSNQAEAALLIWQVGWCLLPVRLSQPVQRHAGSAACCVTASRLCMQ